MNSLGKFTSPVTIFEGPDGSGKTTAAQAYANETGALYVHSGPYKEAGVDLARLYVEAMLPAVQGYQPVVMDRCWLSEQPYGTVFRDGVDRIGPERQRMLERLALRCGAVVVLCAPPLPCVLENLRQRDVRHEFEVFEDKVRRIYKYYTSCLDTHLPCIMYNYTTHKTQLTERVEPARRIRDVNVRLASRQYVPVIVVVPDFEELHFNDPLYRWPGASFAQNSYGFWLAKQLGRVSELNTLWLTTSEVTPGVVNDIHNVGARRQWVTIGDEAYAAVRNSSPKITGDSVHRLTDPRQFVQLPLSYPLEETIQRALAS